MVVVLDSQGVALLAELGIVPVTVVDSYNRYIPGLEQRNFTLYEDKIQQPISYFSNLPLPISATRVQPTHAHRSDCAARF